MTHEELYNDWGPAVLEAVIDMKSPIFVNQPDYPNVRIFIYRGDFYINECAPRDGEILFIPDYA